MKKKSLEEIRKSSNDNFKFTGQNPSIKSGITFMHPKRQEYLPETDFTIKDIYDKNGLYGGIEVVLSSEKGGPGFWFSGEYENAGAEKVFGELLLEMFEVKKYKKLLGFKVRVIQDTQGRIIGIKYQNKFLWPHGYLNYFRAPILQTIKG